MILLGLAVFAGLSLNLVMQFALGVQTVGSNTPQSAKENYLPVFQIINLFISVLILWIIYSYILNFIPSEFFMFVLFFPLSALVCLGFEKIEDRLFATRKKIRLFSCMTAYDGLVPASLLLTANIARNFSDAFILSFFFAVGSLAAIIIINEIKRRSALEEIPVNFRGMPLVLISVGLLSMVTGAVAWICFKVFAA